MITGREGPLAQITATMRSAAQVSASAGAAAAQVLDSGATITAKATSALVSVSGSGLAMLDVSWRGIDLVDVQLQTSSGTIMAAGAEELAQWQSAQGAVPVTKAPRDMLDLWVQLAWSLSADVPALAVTTESFNEQGALNSSEAKGGIRASGYFTLEFRYTKASFRPVWANPVWSILELNVSAESQQILDTLQELVQAHYLTAHQGVVVEIDHDCLRAQLKILVRRWYLSSKAVLQELFALRGGGLILAFLSLLEQPSVRAFLRSAGFYIWETLCSWIGWSLGLVPRATHWCCRQLRRARSGISAGNAATAALIRTNMFPTTIVLPSIVPHAAPTEPVNHESLPEAEDFQLVEPATPERRAQFLEDTACTCKMVT